MVPAKSDGSSDSSFYSVFQFLVIMVTLYPLAIDRSLHWLHLLTALGLLDTYFYLSHPVIASAVFQHHHSLFIHKGYNLAVAFSASYFQITHPLTFHQDSATHRATYKSLIFSAICHHQNPPVDSCNSTVKGKENH